MKDVVCDFLQWRFLDQKSSTIPILKVIHGQLLQIRTGCGGISYVNKTRIDKL